MTEEQRKEWDTAVCAAVEAAVVLVHLFEKRFRMNSDIPRMIRGFLI